MTASKQKPNTSGNVSPTPSLLVTAYSERLVSRLHTCNVLTCAGTHLALPQRKNWSTCFAGACNQDCQIGYSTVSHLVTAQSAQNEIMAKFIKVNSWPIPESLYKRVLLVPYQFAVKEEKYFCREASKLKFFVIKKHHDKTWKSLRMQRITC